MLLCSLAINQVVLRSLNLGENNLTNRVSEIMRYCFEVDLNMVHNIEEASAKSRTSNQKQFEVFI